MQQQNADEIDLRKLVLTIWRNKAQLVACIFIFVLASVAYAVLVTPTYEASSNILPPTPANLSSYNVVAQSDDLLPALKTDEAYRIFLRHLNSGALKLAFFDKHYIPKHATSPEPSISEREELWAAFNTTLSIAMPSSSAADLATVRMTGENPTIISEWVNEYIKMALTAAGKQASDTLLSAISARIQRLSIDIASLRATAEQERLNRISRLKEDLVLARSIDLKNPPSNTNLIISYNQDTAYLRGSIAIEAELKLLEARANNDPFIEDLAQLNEQLLLLKGLELNDTPLQLAIVDNYALAPETPIKPKKKLIVLLGLILGFSFGIIWVLIRSWWTEGTLST